MIDGIIDRTIGKEGKYVNNPNDRGGETIWGITVDTARSNGYTGSMKAMSRDIAFTIYKSQYFIKPGFAAVAEVSETVAEELFDTGVNMGPSVPKVWLQEWLNALNRQGKDYPDIVEDGKIGPGTINALKAFFKVRGKTDGEKILLIALNASQGEKYKQLARGRVQNEEFVFGWLANRVGL